MIRGVQSASRYVYSPIGSCETSECSRLLLATEAGDTRFILSMPYASVTGKREPGSRWFLRCRRHPDSGSPERAAGQGRASVTERLAAALVSEGLGRRAWSGLRRAIAVRKSATAPPGATHGGKTSRFVRHRMRRSAAISSLRAGAHRAYRRCDHQGQDPVWPRRHGFTRPTRARGSCFRAAANDGHGSRGRSIVPFCVGEIRWRAG